MVVLVDVVAVKFVYVYGQIFGWKSDKTPVNSVKLHLNVRLHAYFCGTYEF